MKRYVILALVLALIGSRPGFAQVAETAPSVGDSATKSGEAEQQMRVLIEKARAASIRGDSAEAERHLSSLVDLAYTLYDMENYELAESVLNQVLMLRSDYGKALFALAELYRETHRPQWAVARYTAYLKGNPADPKAWFGRGTCYYTRGVFDLAIHDLAYLVEKLQPKHVLGLANLAFSYRAKSAKENNDLELFEKGVGCVNRAVEAAQDSTDEEIQGMLPELRYYRAQFLAEREGIISKSRPKDVNFTDAKAAYEDAMRTANLALREDPRDLNAISILDLCYSGLGRIYAIEAQLDPKDPEPHMKLAQLTQMRSRLKVHRDRVIELQYIEQAVAIVPTNARYHALRAQALMGIGSVDAALQAIGQARKLDPSNEDYRTFETRLRQSTQPVRRRSSATPGTQPAAE